MNQHLVPKQGMLLAPSLDYILLDGSGSMISKWLDTLAGLDSYFNTLRAANMNSHGILHVFSGGDELELIQRDSTISDWPRFDAGTVDLPGGNTYLYDAINIMVRRLAELDPKQCSIVIVTDGEASHGQTTTFDQAKALLDWCRAQGWQVIFLGADFNNSGQARQLGATTQTYIGVQKGRIREAGEALGEKRIKYHRTGEDMGFSDDEKKDFGGYLAAPTK